MLLSTLESIQDQLPKLLERFGTDELFVFVNATLTDDVLVVIGEMNMNGEFTLRFTKTGELVKITRAAWCGWDGTIGDMNIPLEG